MNNTPCPIHPDDLPRISQMHADYLADEDGTQTSAAQLQDQAYRLGYLRGIQRNHIAISLLEHIRNRHSSGISQFAREAIDDFLLSE